MVEFRATKAEGKLIEMIATRAVNMARKRAVDYDIPTAIMDIEATHSNGNRLDLERMLAADDFNFSHDVLGIRRHLNRSTGKLEDSFVPRFTIQEKGKA